MKRKTGKINIPVLNKLWKSSFLLAVVINLVFLLSILIFCDIKYEVSDDFLMAAIMSGAYGEGPNPHMIFVNILWGYLMLPFYYLLPQISWYFIFQLVLCFCSFTIISYMLFEKLEKSAAMMLTILLLTFFADDAYILVQFTKTAMFAVMGGGIVFAWSLFEQKAARIKIIAAFICLSGTLVRFNTVYIAGGFLLFILGVEFVRFFREKEEKKQKMKRFFHIAIPGILVIAIAFGMKWANNFIYNQDEAYKYFKQYGKARGEIVDATNYGYEAYAEELKKIGVSENDYALMRTWNFADREVFTLEVMEKTADIIADYKKNMEISKEMVLENIQTRGLTGYPVFLGCVVLFILSIVFQRKDFWTGFIASGIAFLYILYFFVVERILYRIEFCVFAGAFLCMVYFWKKVQGQNEGDSVEFFRICAIIILVCIVLEMPLYLPDRSYQDVTNESRREYVDSTFYESWNYDARKYRKAVNKGKPENALIEEIQSNPDNLYFLDFQTTIQTLYYEWSPFQALPAQYFDNALYFASVMTNFPDEIRIMESHGVTQPLKDLIKENVYLVDTDTRTLENKMIYIQEHYYPEARAELYKEIDGYQIWKIYEK